MSLSMNLKKKKGLKNYTLATQKILKWSANKLEEITDDSLPISSHLPKKRKKGRKEEKKTVALMCDTLEVKHIIQKM